MKLTVKQLKQLIKEQVEEVVGSTEGEDNKSTSFRDSLADMLDELVDATTNATVYDDIPELRAKADRHLAAVKVKILNQVVSQIDYAKQGK